MDDCGVKHQCADGRSGECRQVQGHLTRHLCRECLAFFTTESTDGPEPAMRAVLGTHPSVQAFLQMEEAARASAAVRGSRPGDGPFQLSGVWKATIATPYGELLTELILQPDNRFSQLSTLNGLMAYDVGTIELRERFIHFVVTDHEPKQYHGVRVKWLESFGYYYTVVDANTMDLEDRIAHARWTVHRG